MVKGVLTVLAVLVLLFPAAVFSQNDQQQNEQMNKQQQSEQMNKQQQSQQSEQMNGQQNQMNQKQNQMNQQQSEMNRGKSMQQAQKMTSSQNLTIKAELTTGVENREPTMAETQFPATVDSVVFWTQVMGANGNTEITHEWYYNGKLVASVKLPVDSPSWRTWSYKTIPSGDTGNWKVQAVGPDGNVLASESFTVGSGTTAK